jgi:TonB family protein
MKTKVSILLIGIIFSCFSGFAKKIDFYIPPISKVRIDPSDWELPYTKPYAFIAPMFKGNSNKVIIKNKIDLITYTFTCMYLPDDSLQAKYRYSDGKRKAKNQPMVGNFGIYESTYYESKDKITYFIDKTTPNFVLIVSVDFPISNKEKLENVKKFLTKFEKVDPSEIDEAVGYPLDKSILLDTLKKGRIAIDRKYNSNPYYYGSNTERERKLVMDYTVGFTYKEYFEARIRQERNNFTDDEKARYAFHLSGGLKGLILLDSMSDGAYASSKNEVIFMKDYLKSKSKTSDFDFYYATEIKKDKNGYWWFLTDDADFSIALVTSDADGKLKFQHHIDSTSFWQHRGNFMERQPSFFRDWGDENYKSISLMGQDSTIIKFQKTTNIPTPEGIEYQGITTFFVDTKKPNSEIVKFETMPFQDNYKLVYTDLGNLAKVPTYSDTEWNLKTSGFNFAIYYDYPLAGWQRHYRSTYSESYENKLASFNRLENVSQDSTLIISKVESISVNGIEKLVRSYISNGKLLSCDVLVCTSNGISKGKFDSALEAELLKRESMSTLLEHSKKKYAAFNNQESPRNEMVSISNSHLKEKLPQGIQDIILLPQIDGKDCFTISEAEIKAIISDVKYPESARKKRLGGAILLDVILEPSGKLISAKAVNSIPGAPELSAEAERLIKTFGKFSKGTHTPDTNTTIQVSIRFVP